MRKGRPRGRPFCLWWVSCCFATNARRQSLCFHHSRAALGLDPRAFVCRYRGEGGPRIKSEGSAGGWGEVKGNAEGEAESRYFSRPHPELVEGGGLSMLSRLHSRDLVVRQAHHE